MPQINRTKGKLKRDITEIKKGENSRKKIDIEGIKELAESIERHGQLQPIIIDESGNLKAGYRRLEAHFYLVKQGKPFYQIECIVKKGETFVINLIENIQRENLSYEDKEAALVTLRERGLSVSDIAKKLNKRDSWVSDTIKAYETRKRAEEQGADTSDISTSAMSQMRSVPDNKIQETIEETKANGGTVKAASEAASKRKTKRSEKPNKKKQETRKDPFTGLLNEIKKLIKKGHTHDEIISYITNHQAEGPR